MADYPNFAGEAQFKDTASVPTPPANNLSLYSDGGVLKTKNSSGTVTTLGASNMVGATSSVAGTAGLVPAPAAGDQEKFLRGNATWQSQYPQFSCHPQRFESGDYLFPPALTTQTGNANSGFLVCYPIFLPTLTIDRIGCEVTAAAGAGSLGRLGIYNSSASTNYPSTLLLDAGTVSVSSTGKREATINQSITQGIYWIAYLADTVSGSAPTLRQFNAVPMFNFRKNQNDSVFQYNGGYRAGSVASGSLPSPFPSGATLLDIGGGGIHIIYLRVA